VRRAIEKDRALQMEKEKRSRKLKELSRFAHLERLPFDPHGPALESYTPPPSDP